MTAQEVAFVLESLRKRIGEKVFMPVAKQVYFNLNEMKPGTSFDFLKYFKGDRLEIFFVVAHRYLIDHIDYSFTGDYSSIRRADGAQALALLTKLKARKETEIEETT